MQCITGRMGRLVRRVIQGPRVRMERLVQMATPVRLVRMGCLRMR